MDAMGGDGAGSLRGGGEGEDKEGGLWKGAYVVRRLARLSSFASCARPNVRGKRAGGWSESGAEESYTLKG